MKTIDEINSMFKMFGIDAKVTHIPQNALPFHLQGKLEGNLLMGMSRATFEEIEALAQGYINDRPEPSIGSALRDRIADRDK